ncbi:hypothetical protein [Kineothrix sp. MB12-C1]|uniref:hypothetical protein n=1 Tax=Kineothrix sp. MB12-C1 TaxID=3070215 RepID=UPI0027D2993E|nr:hypothetical protein [Kineothrix sp. MB12-C1]WMC94372.1 hypothetical protein RBB56_09015 [Kineothrix sp. MB12-C1]
MERKDNIMNRSGFIAQTFIIFGITILVIMGIALTIGEEDMRFSTLFRLGNQGIAFRTLSELLLSSVCISAIERIFYKEKYFGSLSYLMRTILMLLCVTALMIVFILYFGWFPAYSWQGWLGFFLSFSICFGASTAVMVIKTKWESKIYEQRLEEYKKRQKSEISGKKR